MSCIDEELKPDILGLANVIAEYSHLIIALNLHKKNVMPVFSFGLFTVHYRRPAKRKSAGRKVCAREPKG